ncbi:ATP-binding protein [Clostridium facile]|uniref:ATP-binding protein n=1 Tax=Clostridium facile TaxID=2763035 RepID=A0ABR7INW4_9CLOT|nr:ATP-binding protein [Clostridium facile]MBC5786764.1 ATP-binding protein [Clostridium facile]
MSLTEAAQAIAAKHGICLERLNCSLERQVEILNNRSGDLQGYDCPICKNKGWIYRAVDGEIVSGMCKCMHTRQAIAAARKSGASELIANCKFENFITSEPYQSQMLNMAKRYLQDPSPKWLYYGGQSGCGKTHICTAVFWELIKRGLSARYITWRREIAEVKRYANNPLEYATRMDKYKSVDVLYIDDLFKTINTADRTGIQAGDINVAFELLDYRYSHSAKITLISSELTLRQVLTLDQAIGGRIRQKCGQYVCNIAPAPNKNYRLSEKAVENTGTFGGTPPSYDLEELSRRGMHVPEI